MDGSQRSNDLFYLLDYLFSYYFYYFFFFIYQCGLTFGNINLMLRDYRLEKEFQGFEKVRGAMVNRFGLWF